MYARPASTIWPRALSHYARCYLRTRSEREAPTASLDLVSRPNRLSLLLGPRHWLLPSALLKQEMNRGVVDNKTVTLDRLRIGLT